MDQNQINSEFASWINSLKKKVQSAIQKIAFSINSQLLELYWEIGKDVDSKLKSSN